MPVKKQENFVVCVCVNKLYIYIYMYVCKKGKILKITSSKPISLSDGLFKLKICSLF